MTKRHAKPTTAQLVDRIYRKQLAMYDYFAEMDRHLGINERTLRDNFDSLRSGQKMLSERLDSLNILASHCERLLREKETLQKQVEILKANPSYLVGTPEHSSATEQELRRAASYMAAPLRPRERIESGHVRLDPCMFGHLHRAGTTCKVCGWSS
jgi:hypothetical protein